MMKRLLTWTALGKLQRSSVSRNEIVNISNCCFQFRTSSIPKVKEIPDKALGVESEAPVDRTLTLDLLNHLERTSLVDFGSEEALTRLQEAIDFASILFEVDTAGVEPMISVLDESRLRLREDVQVDTNRSDILMNASITEEDYFLSPPGNIPLESKTNIQRISSKP